VPVYNRERLVTSAIRSVLGQSFRDLECLVIDDGSTDRTAEVVAAIDDPRLRLVRNPHNLGIPWTRNRGIDLARGAYVAMLDSDDVALPHRLQVQTSFLDSHPDVAAVGSWVRLIDDGGKLLGRERKGPASPRAIELSLLFRTVPMQSSMLFRRPILERYRYREDFPVMQDRELFGRLARREKITCLQESLVHMREHAGRITRARRADRDALRRKIVEMRLREMGIRATADDVDRHILLGREEPGAGRVALDAEMLAWAERWMLALVERARCEAPEEGDAVFEEAAFLWQRFLRRARDRVGRGVLRRYLDSPLTRPHRAAVQRWLKPRYWRRLKRAVARGGRSV
jgi:glycosyltransferase involved in cell wall biosynthesis